MRFTRSVAGILSAFAAAALLSGCAGTCGVASTGTTLEYRMDEGRALAYRQTSHMIQTMDVRGQSVPVESNEVLEFSLLPGETSGGLLRLGVTIDDVSVVATAPQGSVEADVADALGRSFDMTLSVIGEEGGLPDSETLVYTLEPQGDRSLIPMFGSMFPDLPGHPVDVGDTWPSTITMEDDTGDTELRITIDAVNTLEGFEEHGGHDCARISAVLTGVIEGSGSQEGADWSMFSETEGTGIWHFAHREGILVSDVTEGTASGSITVDAPNGEIEIPVTRTYTMSTELIE